MSKKVVKVCKDCDGNGECIGWQVQEMAAGVQAHADKIELLRKLGRNVSASVYAEELIDLANKAREMNEKLELYPACPMASAIALARVGVRAGYYRLNRWGVNNFINEIENASRGLFGIPLAKMK